LCVLAASKTFFCGALPHYKQFPCNYPTTERKPLRERLRS
jgi:hypothetical protein